jgi:LmbE family N-acetylglucosaminyl deacetylase
VTVVALTAGTRVHDVVISDTLRFRDRMPDAVELIALMAERTVVKEDEVRSACAFLGVTDVRFFRYDDAVLTLTEELILRMASLIREVRPDVVITHHPNENAGFGSHHAATARLVLEGISAAYGVGLGDPNPPYRVAQVFFTVGALQIPLNSLVGAWYPDLIVDITDVVEAKVRAIDAMRSQQYGGDYARKRIELTDGSIGAIVGVAYAEGYITYLPEVTRLLPVSDLLREFAAESEADTMARFTQIIATKVDLPD